MVAKTNKTTWLINIFILVSACLAIYFGLSNERELFTFFKPLTTIFVIAVPFFAPKNGHVTFGRLVIVGLVFCLLGGLLLLFDAYFLFGLGAFLLAHILFSISFV